MKTAALHRLDDPDTSVAAAESLKATSITRLEEMVWQFVYACGERGATTEEISNSLQLPRVTVSPRMKPLEKKGLVQATDLRRKGTSGRMSIVWIANNLRRKP